MRERYAPSDEQDKTHETFRKMQEAITNMIHDPKGYFDAMSRFHQYSWGNIGMILSQRPDATHVAGLRTWNSLGRWVNKGERGIAILAPITHTLRVEDDEGKPITIENIRGFRTAHVYDVTQTHGKPLPELPIAPVTSQSALGDEIWSRVSDYVVSRGVSHYKQPMAQNGVWKPYRGEKGEIWTSTLLRGDQEVKTFIHEAAHMEAEHRGGSIDRSDAECVAEGAAYATLKRFGIDTSGYSFGYIASWARDGKVLARNMQATQRIASRLISVIEKGIDN